MVWESNATIICMLAKVDRGFSGAAAYFPTREASATPGAGSSPGALAGAGTGTGTGTAPLVCGDWRIVLKELRQSKGYAVRVLVMSHRDDPAAAREVYHCHYEVGGPAHVHTQGGGGGGRARVHVDSEPPLWHDTAAPPCRRPARGRRTVYCTPPPRRSSRPGVLTCRPRPALPRRNGLTTAPRKTMTLAISAAMSKTLTLCGWRPAARPWLAWTRKHSCGAPREARAPAHPGRRPGWKHHWCVLRQPPGLTRSFSPVRVLCSNRAS